MVVLRRAMLGAGTHRDPVLSILSGDDHPEVQLICATPITSSLEPGVRILHRPCRPLLRGLEQAHRAALDDHVHRPTRLGQWVLISGSWYKLAAAILLDAGPGAKKNRPGRAGRSCASKVEGYRGREPDVLTIEQVGLSDR